MGVTVRLNNEYTCMSMARVFISYEIRSLKRNIVIATYLHLTYYLIINAVTIIMYLTLQSTSLSMPSDNNVPLKKEKQSRHFQSRILGQNACN